MATKTNALLHELCKALGLDADRVSMVVLTCEAGEVPTAEVAYVAVDAETGGVATELRNYELRDVT